MRSGHDQHRGIKRDLQIGAIEHLKNATKAFPGIVRRPQGEKATATIGMSAEQTQCFEGDRRWFARFGMGNRTDGCGDHANAEVQGQVDYPAGSSDAFLDTGGVRPTHMGIVRNEGGDAQIQAFEDFQQMAAAALGEVFRGEFTRGGRELNKAKSGLCRRAQGILHGEAKIVKIHARTDGHHTFTRNRKQGAVACALPMRSTTIRMVRRFAGKCDIPCRRGVALRTALT